MKPSKFHLHLFCIITGIYWFSLYTYVPILSTYSQILGASYTMIGLIAGSYGLTQMLVRIPIGVISDRIHRRKPFIILGLFLTCASALGMYLFPTPHFILFFRGLSGVAAGSWVTFTILYASYFDPLDTPKAIGTIIAYNSAGNVLGLFLGGVISEFLGESYTFIFAFIIGLIGLFLSLFIFEEHSIPNKKSKESLNLKDFIRLFKNPNILWPSFLAIIVQLVVFASIFGFTPILAKKLGANNFQLGLLTTFFATPRIFASGLSGTFFNKRFGMIHSIILGFIGLMIMTLFTPFANNLYVLYTLQIFGGIGYGLSFSLLMSLSIQKIEVNARGTAMGIFQSIYGLGIFLGPVLNGILGEFFPFHVSFLMISLLCLVGIWILKKREWS